MHCKVFKDNSGDVEMARIDKYRPRTKHFNVNYHHFRLYIGKRKGGISIHKIDNTHQLADLLKKPLSNSQFRNLRKRIMGW